jgi:hypothetical protein
MFLLAKNSRSSANDEERRLNKVIIFGPRKGQAQPNMKHPITISLVAIVFASTAFAAQSKQKPEGTNIQPLTYANVVSHFKAAHLRTTEVQKRCTIFFEGEWKNADIYNYGLIIVENSDEDLQVTFYLTDAHEMNWVTEFFDAPFFARAETEKLFDLINSNREVRAHKIGRFHVDFHHWLPRHAQILVFSFTPTGTNKG